MPLIFYSEQTAHTLAEASKRAKVAAQKGAN